MLNNINNHKENLKSNNKIKFLYHKQHKEKNGVMYNKVFLLINNNQKMQLKV